MSDTQTCKCCKCCACECFDEGTCK